MLLLELSYSTIEKKKLLLDYFCEGELYYLFQRSQLSIAGWIFLLNKVSQKIHYIYENEHRPKEQDQ